MLTILNSVDKEIEQNKPKISNVDITNPKFAINSDKQKIFITAKQGNFINKDEILLKSNVRFKSKEFSIKTNSVIFDRKKQNAYSDTQSFFKSKNTTIISEGFDIYDKGNKIIFYGNSSVKIKWDFFYI